MRRLLTNTLMTAIALLTSAMYAEAQLEYQFADLLGNPTTTFQANLGQVVTIQVYLVDTSPNQSVLRADDGLGGAAVRLRYDNPGGIVTVAGAADAIPASSAVGGPWDFVGNPQFDIPNTVGFAVGTLNLSGGVVPLPGSDRILLGIFRLTVLAEGTTTLRAEDQYLDFTGDIASYTSSFEYDDPASGVTLTSATATFIVPIPEPATTLAVAALGMAGVAAVRRRVRVRVWA